MKKIIASILVICIAISSVITSFGQSVDEGAGIITNQVNLSLSERLKAKNEDNSVNTAITSFVAGETLSVIFSNNPMSSGFSVGSNTNNYSDASKQFTLEYTESDDYSGYAKIEKNKKYIVNIDFSATPNQSQKVQIGLISVDSPNENKTGKFLACKEFSNGALNDNQTLSAVIDGGSKTNYLRLFFGGRGKAEIKSVVVKEIDASNSNDYVAVTYINEGIQTAEFVNKDAHIEPKFEGGEGAIFGGWFEDSALTIKSLKPEDGKTYYAKWLTYNIIDNIDLSYSQLIREKNNSNQTVIVKETKEDKTLSLTLSSGWNNVFRDANNNIKTGVLWPDAIMALKYDDGTVPASYVKFQKDYKYIVNVEYEVVAADSYYNPQIAIVKNNSTNSAQNNGSVVLNTNTHSAPGSYTLSAVVSNIDNIPIRLAFAGLGTVNIKSVKISKEKKNETDVIDITYMDGVSSYSQFHKLDSDLYIPVKDGYVFDGWYDKDGKKVDDIKGVTTSLTLYAKWTGISFFDIDPTNSQSLKDKNSANAIVMELTADEDNKTLDVSLNSGWNNIFRDKNGNLRTKTKDSNGNYVTNLLWPDAVLALKYDIGTEPSSYVKLQKAYEYVINIDYSVTSVYTDFAPQIAIVRNGQTNSTGINGAVVLNANTHMEKGDYSISAHTKDIDNIPLRLAFGGIGRIVIKKITVSAVLSSDNSYIPVMYVDGELSVSEFIKKDAQLSNPEDMTGFKGWYKNADCIGKPITKVDEAITVYAKRNLAPYTFNIDFDTKATKDFYKSGNHTLSDFETIGSKAEIVLGVGTSKSDAARLTYKRIDKDSSDYASNPMLALYDTNITEGEITDKRFLGKTDTQYVVTFKYKVEETDNKSLELYLGKRNRGQSGNAGINDFGTGLWQISDTVKIGETITKTTKGWVEAKAYFTASSGWFPVILLKTNNQTKNTETDSKLASVLIDDICVTEIVPIMEDTYLGKMDYENYETKVYDSTAANGIIGNKYGLEVSTDANHTSKGKKSLKLTLQSDSLQYSGNTVVSIDNEPLRTEKNAAYIVEFWVMSKVDIDDVIWGVNSVGGAYEKVTSRHTIEIRDKINLKANKWQKVEAYIPKLASFEDTIGMLSIALAANGNDGKAVYIDDISVEQKIESEVVNFVDSDTENPFAMFAQRGFKGKKINSLPYAEKDGYLFDGWYDTPECDGEEYKVSNVFPKESDEITLYAKWIDASKITAKDFTAGSFDADIYNEGVIPYENICETSFDTIYGITNTDSTQSGAWVKDSGIYGNGTAEYDGTLSLSNDTYSRFLDTNGRNAVSLINEDGTRFAVVKGQKYSIKFDYVNGSNQGTSYIQTVVSTSNGYKGFGYGKDQGLKTIAIHGTDVDYKSYEEYFVADYTGFVYITFAARTDDNSPYTSLYHRIYIDNLEIKVDNDVKKVNFIADGKVHKTYYGKEGDKFPVFDVIEGDNRTSEFEGFYKEAEFKNKITEYKLTGEDVQSIYIKYKDVEYTTPSNFSKPITIDFEETKILDDYYRQGKHMTYWSRGEQNPEWQFISNDKANAYSGKNYIKLNGYTTYWNEAKFVLYDTNNKSGTMLLEKGATYRVKVMSRCEDKYDIPNLTITLENPTSRYLLASNDKVTLVYDQVEYKNGYMCFVADITVPDNLAYLPSLAIRKNANDLQTLFIDSVNVEKIIDCKVKFEENGGTEIEDVTVQIHEKLDDPGMPYKDGYEFIGWYSDSKFKNLWNFETMTVESDMTLYAKWVVATADEDSLGLGNDENSDDSQLDDMLSDFDSDDLASDDVTEDGYGSAPILLEGDKYDYPANAQDNGLSVWIIVLISVGGLLILSGTGVLVWWLIARKKIKK